MRAQSVQTGFEITDLAMHVAYVATHFTGGDSAIGNQAVQYISSLSVGQLRRWGIQSGSRHVAPSCASCTLLAAWYQTSNGRNSHFMTTNSHSDRICTVLRQAC